MGDTARELVDGKGGEGNCKEKGTRSGEMLNVVDGEAGLVMWKLSKLHKAAIKGGFLDPENSLPSITLPITPQISKLKSFQSSGQDPNFLYQQLKSGFPCSI